MTLVKKINPTKNLFQKNQVIESLKLNIETPKVLPEKSYDEQKAEIDRLVKASGANINVKKDSIYIPIDKLGHLYWCKCTTNYAASKMTISNPPKPKFECEGTCDLNTEKLDELIKKTQEMNKEQKVKDSFIDKIIKRKDKVILYCESIYMLKDKFYFSCRNLFNKIPTIGTLIIGGISALAAIKIGATIWSFISGGLFTNMHYNPTDKRAGVLKNFEKSKAKYTRSTYHTQALDNTLDMLVPVMQANEAILETVGGKIGCTFIKDKMFITAKHFALYLYDAITIKTKDYDYRIEKSEYDFLELEGRDIVIIKIFDKKFPSFKDISKFLITDDTINYLYEASVVFVTPKNTKTSARILVREVSEYTHSVSGEKVFCKDSFTIPYSGVKGECGYFYAINNPRLNNKRLCGIHVAGSSTNSCAAIFTLDDFNVAENEFKQNNTTQGLDNEPIFDPATIECGNVKIIRIVDKSEKTRMPTKSEITKTLMYDPDKSTTEVLPLTRRDGVSPLQEGLKKKN